MAPVWKARGALLRLLAAHPAPERAGRELWRSAEPWLGALLDAAREPGALLAELPQWASLLDRHSTVELRVEERGTVAYWRNVRGAAADALECEFRLGALRGLLDGGSADVRRDVVHLRCAARGEAECVFAVEGLAPRPEPAHERLLTEALRLSGALQAREDLFRRLSSLSARMAPFPGARDLRAVRRFIEELDDPILIFDDQLRVLDANEAAVGLSGLRLDELRGLSARDLLAADSFRRLCEALPPPLEASAVRELLVDFQGRGRAAKLEVSARVSGDGRVVVCLARDVSERLRLEQELAEHNRRLEEQNARISQADRLKSEFLANVSHELTTPITCIKGFAKLLLGDLGAERAGHAPRLDLDKRMEFLQIVQRESERMTALIRGLLELSRIEAGVVSLDRTRTSLNAIAQEALLVLKPRFDERELVVDLALDPELPAGWLDADRMKQVVLNLLDNAIKFSEPGNRIALRTGCSAEALRVAVRNASRDLTESDLTRIFERFVQRDGTFARQHGGVGLGLNLVRAIVELHGGRVWGELPEPGCVEIVAEVPLAAL